MYPEFEVQYAFLYPFKIHNQVRGYQWHGMAWQQSAKQYHEGFFFAWFLS